MSNLNKLTDSSPYFQELSYEEGAAINGGVLILFDGSSFNASSVSGRTSNPNLGNIGFDNRASSAINNDTRRSWQLFENFNFTGRSVILRPGTSLRLASFSNLISSARLV